MFKPISLLDSFSTKSESKNPLFLAATPRAKLNLAEQYFRCGGMGEKIHPTASRKK